MIYPFNLGLFLLSTVFFSPKCYYANRLLRRIIGENTQGHPGMTHKEAQVLMHRKFWCSTWWPICPTAMTVIVWKYISEILAKYLIYLHGRFVGSILKQGLLPGTLTPFLQLGKHGQGQSLFWISSPIVDTCPLLSKQEWSNSLLLLP